MTPPDPDDATLRENGQLVDALRGATTRGDMDLRLIPELVKSVIRRECWRDRILDLTGERVRFERFVEFVRAAAPAGLGCELDILRRICAHDSEARDLLDQATAQPHGGDHTSTRSKLYNIQLAPGGTSADRALRRLRQDRPDLHARVLAGELSPHAAATLAGYRKEQATVRATPQSIATTARRLLSAAEIEELIALLRDDGGA